MQEICDSYAHSDSRYLSIYPLPFKYRAQLLLPSFSASFVFTLVPSFREPVWRHPQPIKGNLFLDVLSTRSPQNRTFSAWAKYNFHYWYCLYVLKRCNCTLNFFVGLLCIKWDAKCFHILIESSLFCLLILTQDKNDCHTQRTEHSFGCFNVFFFSSRFWPHFLLCWAFESKFSRDD